MLIESHNGNEMEKQDDTGEWQQVTTRKSAQKHVDTNSENEVRMTNTFDPLLVLPDHLYVEEVIISHHDSQQPHRGDG